MGVQLPQANLADHNHTPMFSEKSKLDEMVKATKGRISLSYLSYRCSCYRCSENETRSDEESWSYSHHHSLLPS